jgi:hypothetical protein
LSRFCSSKVYQFCSSTTTDWRYRAVAIHPHRTADGEFREIG